MKRKFYIYENTVCGDCESKIIILANDIVEIGWTQMDNEEFYTILVDNSLMSFSWPISIVDTAPENNNDNNEEEHYYYFFERKTGNEFIVKDKNLSTARVKAINIINELENNSYICNELVFDCECEFTAGQADTSGFDIYF